MKHNLKVTAYLILLFLAAQIIGLYLLNISIEKIQTNQEGNIEVQYSEPITGRPELEGKESFNYIVIMILVGTALLLLLIKFRLFKVWKAWFFLAIWGSLAIAFSVIIKENIALILGLILTYFKIYKPNAIIHNLTEVFIYAGITIMIAPIFSVYWAIMLLLAISVYDAIAVWKSKHMIKLAEAQTQNKMFAGLLIPYTNPKKKKTSIKISIPKNMKSKKVNSAILGGGDIAFPMIFAGSVMTFLIQSGLPKEIAYFQSLIIALFSGIALFILFIKSEKGKFYPAMPFITAGCLVGYGIIMLLHI